MTSMKTLTAVLSLATTLLVGAVAVPAHAAPVTQLEYLANTSNPVLMVVVNGTTSFAQLPSPGCGVLANSADTIKTWLSLLQMSFLSGKNASIYTSSCNSKNYIYDVVIN